MANHHHVATRLTPAQYQGLERIRAREGLRSLNAAVGWLIERDQTAPTDRPEAAAVAG